MSKEFKSLCYYYSRRNMFEHVLQQCDQQLNNNKGKDPIILFYKAYAIGMLGDVRESLHILDSFHSRRDLQLPVTLATLHFQKLLLPLDREAIRALESEIPIAEDMAVSIYHYY